MTNKKALFNWTLTVTLMVFIAFMSACKTSTDPEPEPPIEPEPIERVGTKELTINVIDRGDESDLTGYNIEIEGPVTASESGVSTAQFTLEDVESGEYTITVTRDGYVRSQLTEVLEVPEEVSSDYYAETTISLRESTPPVTVSNNEDTTVQTGEPDEEDADEEEAISIQIPANSFPASAVNQDGTVSISVTRAKPTTAKRSDAGLVAETIYLTPEADLNNTVTITVPVRELAGLENVQYFLQPGNIPLTADGNGNLVATITPERSASEDFNQVGNSHGVGPLFLTAPVNRFGPFDVTADLTVTETDGFSEFVELASQCGTALNVPYSIAGISVPAQIKKFGGDYKRFETNRTVAVTANAIPNRIVTIRARHATRTLTLSDGGTQLASVTVNRAVVNTTDPISRPCHNSGG